MKHEISLAVPSSPLALIGQVANDYASQGVFKDYHDRRAPNTLRRQRDDLALFSTYLAQASVIVDADALYDEAEAWRGITFGLVDGFVRWMLAEGYAIGSVNVRLATIKRYCALCAKALTLPTSELGMIRLVEAYRPTEGRNIDQGREVTRRGHKKAEAVSISKEQSILLKSQPDTPQGRRDALLMCLLLDHGLRCGEIADLKPESINLPEGTFTVYREKGDDLQTHKLSIDTLRAAQRYFAICQPIKTLLQGSRKSGKLERTMSRRAITQRVNTLGERIGLPGLGAHDGRHAWATFAARNGTPLDRLQQAGGWKSLEMPMRYIEASKIANEGVKLG